MSTTDEMGLTPEAAQGYEDFFVPAIFDQWPPVILGAAGVSEGDNVLEVGCGTGVLTREVIKWVGSEGKVVGFDFSESMLGVARRVCPDVEFKQGNAIDLPFEDDSFDVVIASFMLMFVPDQALAVKEMWRVLRPGGRLVISVWDALDKNPVYAGLVEIAGEYIDENAANSLAWPFALGASGQLAEICSNAGILDASVNAHDGRAKFPSIEVFVTTEIQAWLLGESVKPEELAKVVSESEERFAKYCNDEGALDIPLNALLATAGK